MKIGIDIDTIRNVNPRIIKYYTEYIDNSFKLKDDIKEEDIDIDKELKFSNKNEKNQFFHIDYPYEIYGCSNPFNSNISINFNSWLKNLENIQIEPLKKVKLNFLKKLFRNKLVKNINNEIEVGLFGLMSSELIIGSTLFFLSKIGCRCRNIFFPIHSEIIYDKYDIIVTSNPKIIIKKPKNSIVILINRKYNKKYKHKCNLAYDKLDDMINDKDLINKIKKIMNYD